MMIYKRFLLWVLCGVMTSFGALSANAQSVGNEESTNAEKALTLVFKAGFENKASDPLTAKRIAVANIRAGNLKAAQGIYDELRSANGSHKKFLQWLKVADALAAAYREEGSFYSYVKVKRIFSDVRFCQAVSGVRSCEEFYGYPEVEGMGISLGALYVRHYPVEDVQRYYNQLIENDEFYASSLTRTLAEHLVKVYFSKRNFAAAEAVYAPLYRDGEISNAYFDAAVTQAMVTGYLNAGNTSKAYEYYTKGTNGADADLALIYFVQTGLLLDLARALMKDGELEAAHEVYRNFYFFEKNQSEVWFLAPQ